MEIFEMLLDRCPNGNFCIELENGELVSFCGGFEMDADSIQIHSFITNVKHRYLFFLGRVTNVSHVAN